MSSYITTYTRKHFDPVHPDPERIIIEDIAHALSLLCRGNGHVTTFWSVGQHCICCAKEAAGRGFSDRIVLACLLHDASECYMSDVPRPFKQTMQEYICQEETLLSMVYTRYLGTDLTAEEQKRYINYLAERVREADLGLRARDLVLQDFLDKQKEYDERISKLDDVLSRIDSLESSLKDSERKLKAAERKVADLTAKLKFANKNRFGDKSHRTKKKDSDEESDRTKDKDDFDGTSTSLPENSIVNKNVDDGSYL